MSYVQGNYEPVMTPNNCITEEQKRKIYTKILTNLSEIKSIPEIKMALHTSLYISTWDISQDSYVKIIETFFNKPSVNFTDELKVLDKNGKK